MSYPSRNRSFRRIAVGLVFASVIYAGGVSAAPRADREFFDVQAREAVDDPYLSDVFVRPGESLGGPDGGRIPAKDEPASFGTRTESDAQMDDEQLRIEHALEAQAQGGLSGYLVEVADAIVAGDEGLELTGAGSSADDDQIRTENARDAETQGGLSGYLENQQVWPDRE